MDFANWLQPVFPALTAYVHAAWPGVAPNYAWLEALRLCGLITGVGAGLGLGIYAGVCEWRTKTN